MTKVPIPSGNESQETAQSISITQLSRIADRLRTVIWSNHCFTAGMVKPVYGIQNSQPSH